MTMDKYPKVIYLMLGQACNLNCLYCFEGEKCTKSMGQPSEKLYTYLNKLAANCPKDKQPTIIFWGGEPLLYLPIIKDVVGKVKNTKFCIITNGSLLTQDIVDWVNANPIRLNVSWDGKKSSITRGYDVVDDKKSLLLQVKNLGLLGVLSAINAPLSNLLNDFQDFDDEYCKHHKWHIDTHISEIKPMIDMPKELLDFDYTAIADDVARTIDNIWTEKSKSFIQYYYFNNLFHNLAKNKKGCYRRGQCGIGFSARAIDLQGNLYLCHTLDNPAGHIDNYDEFIKKMLWDNEAYKNINTCKQCEVERLCRGGCKLIDKTVRESGYCELRKALYTPIINFYDQILKGDKNYGYNN